MIGRRGRDRGKVREGRNREKGRGGEERDREKKNRRDIHSNSDPLQ